MAASPKEILLQLCEGLNDGLNHISFNVLLLGGTLMHMIVQAMRSNQSDPTSFLVFLQDAMDYYMIWIYTLVLCLRIMGRGLVMNEDSFLRQPWSYLDLIIVILAWLDRVYRFGTLMFFMVLRMAKMLVDSDQAFVSAPRVITRALIAGVGRVSVVFGILVFAMVFFGVLGIQLIGVPGDFHNRCGVSVCLDWDASGECLRETWQAIRPAYVCRQYDDPLKDPAGSCPKSLLFQQQQYNTKSTNVEAAAAVLTENDVTLRCLGPNLVTGSFGPQKVKFARFESVPVFTEYVPVNYTVWQPVKAFNYDNLQLASVVMFSFFYKTSWVQFMEVTLESTHGAVTILFITIIVVVSYYLLNLTVGIMCLNFSESVKTEKLMMGSGGDDDEADDDDEEDDNEDDDDDEQDVEEPGMRQQLLDALKTGPCCGNALFPLHFIVDGICFLLETVGMLIVTKVPIFKQLGPEGPLGKKVVDAVNGVYQRIGKCLRNCCISLNKLAVLLVIPQEDGANTPFNKVTLLLMILYLCTLAAQDDNINSFKCGCTQIDDLTFAKRCAIGTQKVPEVVLPGQDPTCPPDTQCFGGFCTSTWAEVACVNPYANPLTKAISTVTQPMSTSEDNWLLARSTNCAYGLYLHFLLLGWAGFFSMELLIRYVGHQGARNFFTAQSKSPDNPVPKNFKPKTIPNIPNILDTMCILVTVAGVALTEFTLGVQVLNANISLLKTHGEEGWMIFTPSAPREIKFLRLAIVIRVAYRVIPLISSIPIVAVILRGFRGTSRIIVAFVLLCTMVFFFVLLGKELFLYYGPDQGCNACLECEQVGISQVCKDVCQNIEYTGCQQLTDEATCNPNICKWIAPDSTKVTAFESLKKIADDNEDVDEQKVQLAALEGKEPNGVCRFDANKGGRCRANMSNGHFQAISTFDSITEGLLVLFDIVIGANWYTNTVEAVNRLGNVGMLFFVLFFYITNYQFLRLFVCIIAANYELEEDEKMQAQEVILMYEFEGARTQNASIYRKEYDSEQLNENFNPVGTYDDFSFNKHYMKLLTGAKLSLRELLDNQGGDLSSLMPADDDDDDPNKGKLYESDSEDEEEDTRIKYFETDQIANLLTINTVKKEFQKKSGGAAPAEEQTLLERAKVHVQRFIETKIFGRIVLVAVLLSIAAILVEISEDIEFYSSLAFLTIFVTEMLLKFFAMGVFGAHGYFADSFCKLDFLLVLLQIFDILENTFHFVFPEGHPMGNIVKGFRSLRAARLLDKLKAVVPALPAIMLGLSASIPAVLSLIGCNVLILFIFSIIAMEQFGGLFFACNRGGIKPSYLQRDNPLSKIDCIGVNTRAPSRYSDQLMWHEGVTGDSFAFPVPVTWATEGTSYQQLTFNNLPDCYMTFYNLLLRSQIGSTMEALVASTNRDQAPIRMSTPSYALFIIVFQILLGIFVAQVVVGIIMTNLKMKSGVAYHTEEQMVWPATKSALTMIPNPRSGALEEPPVTATNAIIKLFQMVQVKCFHILENWKFRWGMNATVVINCAVLATTHFGASREWTSVAWWINFICLVVFVLEAITKITYDALRYFMNGSDLFDFLITVIGVLEVFLLPRYNLELGLGSLRQFRLIRIGNMFPVFVNMKETIIQSFPEAAAVVILLAVAIFIFGCILQTLFPAVKYGLVLSATSNAANIVSSMTLLFKMSSGAGGRNPSTSWGHYVSDSSIASPRCTEQTWLPTPKDNYQNTTDEWDWQSPMGYSGKTGDSSSKTDCGSPIIATVFFFLFQFLISFIIMPTFVASVINSYFNANLRKLSLISEEDISKYMDVWKDIMDKLTATVKIADPEQDKFDQLIMSLDQCGCTLGFDKGDKSKYTNAKRLIKGFKALKHDQCIVILLAIREKCRPVTIVDHLRRRQATALIVDRSKHMLPKRKVPKEGRLHASVGIPERMQQKKPESGSIKQSNITYSYNIFVMLDQLKNIDDAEMMLAPSEYLNLKFLIEDNDEDLYTYFEEYVENSGDDISPKERWLVLQKFARRAHEVAARSEYQNAAASDRKLKRFKKGGGDGGDDGGEGGGEEEDDEEDDEEDEGEPEDGDEEAEDALMDDLEEAAGGGNKAPEGIDHVYGSVVDTGDGQGILDLRDWMACDSCSEPVNKNWQTCPSCNAHITEPAAPTAGAEAIDLATGSAAGVDVLRE